MEKEEVFVKHVEFTDFEKKLVNKYGDQFVEYRKKFDSVSKNLEELDAPLYVVLALNSYCNMKCKMCARNFENTKDKMTDLSLTVIERIVDECEELKIPSIFLGADAECLLRRDIKDVISCVSKSNIMDKFLISNGTMMTEDICELFVDLQYERVRISLDAATDKTYKKIRGGNLHIVEKNIETLLKKREERKSDFPIISVSFVEQQENKDEVQLFIEKWKEKVDFVDIQKLIDYSSLHNMKEVDELEDKEFRCPSPFRVLYVDYKGNIYPCCTEFGFCMKIGNIETMTLREAWNSEIMKNLRASIKCNKLSKLCKNCAISTV